jgi:protein-tyrosine-phosphatase
MAGQRRLNILFLCTGNSARSIIAEAIVNRDWSSQLTGYSAGSHPKGEVKRGAVHLLRTLNYSTEGLRSKDWSEFAGPGAPRMDFVFTVCDQAAKESCPVWPGHPITANWGVPDPTEATGTDAEIAIAFASTYRMLNQRISIFANLPFGALDRLALERRVAEIGTSSESVEA